MHDLARLYRAEDNCAQAEALFISTLEARKRVLGEAHPDTLSSMDDLGSLYLNQGACEKAESLFRQVSESRQRVLGAQRPDTANALTSLADTLLMQRRYGEPNHCCAMRSRFM